MGFGDKLASTLTRGLGRTKKDNVRNLLRRLDLRWIDWLGIDDGLCAFQSTLGGVAGVDPLGLLWGTAEAESAGKFLAGLVCGGDSLFDHF